MEENVKGLKSRHRGRSRSRYREESWNESSEKLSRKRHRERKDHRREKSNRYKRLKPRDGKEREKRVQCSSWGCCFREHLSEIRSDSQSNACPDILPETKEGESLSRKCHKQRTRPSSKHHHHGHNHNSHFWKRPRTSELKTVSDKEERSSHFVGQNCTHQPPDIESKQVLESSVGIEEVLAPQGQSLVRDLNLGAKLREKRKWDVCASGILGSESERKQPYHSSNERDWLMLSLDRVKASKPSVVDLNRDDFKLGLPYMPLEASKVTQGIDLNVAIEEEEGSLGQSKPLQLPTTVSCIAPMLRPHSLMEGLAPEVFNDTFNSEESKDKEGIEDCALECSNVAGDLQAGTEIICLDDGEDDHIKMEEKRWTFITRVKGEAYGLKHNKHDSNIMDKGASKSQVYGANRNDKSSKSDSSADFLPKTKVEVFNTNEYVDYGRSAHMKNGINLHEKGECIETADRPVDSGVPVHKATNENIKLDVVVPCENLENNISGFKARKKRMVHRTYLPLREPLEIGDKVISPGAVADSEMIAQKAFLNRMVKAMPGMWDVDIVCDLCNKGPSLSLGEWYSWCCGLRFYKCCCAPDLQSKLRLDMQLKKKNKGRNKLWSGKVHKMCGLWSSEVFEENEGEQLQGLFDAVRRGKTLTCAGCGEYGATLGCRVKACRRSFHYPCADRFASQLRCRMWDGVQSPIACQSHRHVEQSCQHSKEKPPDLKKWRYRGRVSRQKCNMRCESAQRGKQPQERALCGSQPLSRKPAVGSEKKSELSNEPIDLSSDSDDTKMKEKLPVHIKHKPDGSLRKSPVGDSIDSIFKGNPSWNQEPGVSRHEDCALYHMGNNLLCADISGGREAVMIPCTNDVDADVAPDFEYITKSRYVGTARNVLDSLLLDEGNLARSCRGCNNTNIDNPHEEVSSHVALITRGRDSDTRMDWQGQPMFGRLPYDTYGRLQLGPEATKIVECNRRCPCGVKCRNRELQKGLTIPLEIFRTKDQRWAVRTMEQIPRGKFVVEYVGEVLTHGEANERRVKNCMSNFSYLFRGDNPEVTPTALLVVDSFKKSNVTRFINRSCEGNLRPYRVYTEVIDPRCCCIGIYATRDIEIGEELSYDNKYLLWQQHG